MLNPFAIQKEIFQKTTQLTHLFNKVKVIISRNILQRVENQNYSNVSSSILQECHRIQEQDLGSLKLYECKICGKQFDDGRKLGGHVSRAHKDDYSISSSTPQSDKLMNLLSQTINETKRKVKKNRYRLQNDECSSITFKKVKQEEQIFQYQHQFKEK